MTSKNAPSVLNSKKKKHHDNCRPIKNSENLNTLNELLRNTKIKLFGTKKSLKGWNDNPSPDLFLRKYPEPFIKTLLKEKRIIRNINIRKVVGMLLKKSIEYEKHLEKILSEKGVIPKFHIDEIKLGKFSRKKYPKRSVNKKYYKEDDLSSEDEFLYCDDCDKDYKGVCLKHGPMLWICDKKVPKNTKDRAIQTLPDFLSLGESSMPKAGLGVWTEVSLPKGIVFGPYKGNVLKDSKIAQNSGYAWKILEGRKTHHYVEAVEKDSSNWLRFINCADVEERQNLLAFQYEKKIYYKTYKPILAYSELLVWYGDEYGEDLGIISRSHNKNPSLDKKQQNFRKSEICQRMFNSSLTKKEHKYSPLPEEKLNTSCPGYSYSTNENTTKNIHLITYSENKMRLKIKTLNSCKNFINPKTGKNSNVLAFSSFDCKEVLQSKFLKKQEKRHEEEKQFKCDICNRSFTGEKGLKIHKKTHTKKVTKCTDCEKEFSRYCNLKNHWKSKHAHAYVYACPICKKNFDLWSSVRKHAHSEHTSELLDKINNLWKEIKNG